jgi:hypothetical protein
MSQVKSRNGSKGDNLGVIGNTIKKLDSLDYLTAQHATVQDTIVVA